MDNYCKKWDNDEDNKLISQINQLKDIDQIMKNHKRSIGGITARIQKIIDDPNLNSQLKNKNNIIMKYFSNNKNKSLDNNYFVNNNLDKYKEEITKNILNFNSIIEINNKYNLSLNETTKILKEIVNNNNLDMSKILRLNYLLNNDEEENEINILNNKKKYNKNSNKNNYNDNNNNDNNDNSNLINLINKLFDEIKSIKSDIFDIRNRVKIIMNSTEKKDNKIKKKALEQLENESDKEEIIINQKNNSKVNKSVNKSLNKLILIDNNNFENSSDKELDKELEKFL